MLYIKRSKFFPQMRNKETLIDKICLSSFLWTGTTFSHSVGNFPSFLQDWKIKSSGLQTHLETCSKSTIMFIAAVLINETSQSIWKIIKKSSKLCIKYHFLVKKVFFYCLSRTNQGNLKCLKPKNTAIHSPWKK